MALCEKCKKATASLSFGIGQKPVANHVNAKEQGLVFLLSPLALFIRLCLALRQFPALGPSMFKLTLTPNQVLHRSVQSAQRFLQFFVPGLWTLNATITQII
jgi:hypothetical protein